MNKDSRADLAAFEKQIEKTGFVLEHAIARQLNKAGWTVISNRYYVDDAEDKVREIDLVAYKSTKVENVRIYTSLIISCKKDQENAWALLARDLDVSNPNSDWWPLHTWTNDKALDFELRQQGISREYHDDMHAAGVKDALRMPPVEVFAFQLMNRNTGNPQNDRPIFDSITSLMKAQSYELTALPLRRKASEACVYQFNLISVTDTDLLRLHLKDDSITASRIQSEHYISRYIVQKKETFSRIQFIKADHFRKSLQDYGRLHTANCKWFMERRARFYVEAIQSGARLDVFMEQFRGDLAWYLQLRVRRMLNKEAVYKELSIEWRKERNMLAITEFFDDDVLKFLNADKDCRNRTAMVLAATYHYMGDFFFDTPEIPF
jgi:hypothetical protein